MAKSRQDELFEMLRARGLRKRAARTLSSAVDRARGDRQPPKAVRRTIKDLRSVLGELESRLPGADSKKRSEAARKAAQTRKRQASRRSAAAKKGARTRAKARS